MSSAPSIAADLASPSLEVADLTVDVFSPLEQQSFQFHYGAAQPEPLQLISVKAGQASHGRPGGRAPFSLVFRANSREFYVPQGTYPLEHAQIGRPEIFFVPIGPDDAGMLFQVVFS
ncbi:MAG: hypothetical protein NTV80_05865 [Verrucomicrobia bacterium]|nr:hypothetical protein [Verrucomicrobiota bacterium]